MGFWPTLNRYGAAETDFHCESVCFFFKLKDIYTEIIFMKYKEHASRLGKYSAAIHPDFKE